MSESAWSQRNSSDSLDSTGDSGDDVDAENDDDDEELDLSGDTPFGSLEVSRLLEDLSETAAQMVKEDLATKVSSSSSGVRILSPPSSFSISSYNLSPPFFLGRKRQKQVGG